MSNMRHVCDAYIRDVLLKRIPNPRILDVGSGNYPHPLASVILDLFEDNRQRTGDMVIPGNASLVIGDVCDMHMFSDKEFDFVIASHVLEHVADPFKACSELSRVAKAGFVETPSKAFELIHGWHFHRWYVSNVNEQLIFERICEHPKIWSKFLQPAAPPTVKISRFLPAVCISHFFPLRFEKAHTSDLFGTLLKKLSYWLFSRFWNAWHDAQREMLYTTYIWEDHIAFEVYDRVRIPSVEHAYTRYNHQHITWAEPHMHFKQRRDAKGNLEYLTSDYPHPKYERED